MPARVSMFARVTVGRGVAAQRGSATLTGAQMYPLGADFHALIALMVFRPLDHSDASEMIAGVACQDVLPRTLI